MKKSARLRLNASAAHTWTHCTAQPHYVQQYADKIPPQDTEFNVEGTIAHGVVEHYLTGKPMPAKANAEMKKHAQGFKDYVKSLVPTGVAFREWSERKVSLFYVPGGNGYIDYALSFNGALHIVDYKYGQGVAVNALNNLQMAIYARSLIEEDKDIPDWVYLHIYQPRVRQGDKTSFWALSYDELVQFTDDQVLGPAEDVLAKKTLKFAPSADVCRFCPASEFCGLKGYEPDFEYEGKLKLQDMLQNSPLLDMLEDETVVLPKPAKSGDELIAAMMEKGAEIKKWIDSLSKYALARAMAGNPIPGTKLVQSAGGHRKWANPESAAITLLRYLSLSDILKLEPPTPKQAEQFEFDVPKAEWTRLQATIVKPEGGPIVVPLDDPRPPYGSSAADLLDDETENL